MTSCPAQHSVQATMRQFYYCDLKPGHKGDHASVAPNVNMPKGFQVIKRWPNLGPVGEPSTDKPKDDNDG